MYDRKLVNNSLVLIRDTLATLISRTSHIRSENDFYGSESGVILLESVCMNLVAIGESIKNLDKLTNRELLVSYPSIDWKGVMGMRDIIVHHYFEVDAGVIVYALRHEIMPLYQTIEAMINDIANDR